MKKFLSVLLLLTFLITSNTGNVAFAAVGTNLNERETMIAKAYIKSYESGKSSSIDKYSYAGTKLTVSKVPKGQKVKVFFPGYCKKYDTESKTYYIFMTGMIVTSDETKLTISKCVTEISLKTKGKKVYANLEKNPKVTMNEISLSDLTVSHLDKIKTYINKTYSADIASKLLYVKPGNLISTFDSPVELGSKYTYEKSFSGKGDRLSGKFSFTVNSVSDLTDADLNKLGYVKSKDELDRVGSYGYLDYKLVNVTWCVKDAKIIERSNANKTGNAYVRDIVPKVTASAYKRDPSAYYGCFVLDGFTGSFQSNMDNEFKNRELKADSTISITMSGNIVFPVVHVMEEAYMTIAQPGNDNWGDFMYFKLK